MDQTHWLSVGSHGVPGGWMEEGAGQRDNLPCCDLGSEVWWGLGALSLERLLSLTPHHCGDATHRPRISIRVLGVDAETLQKRHTIMYSRAKCE